MLSGSVSRRLVIRSCRAAKRQLLSSALASTWANVQQGISLVLDKTLTK